MKISLKSIIWCLCIFMTYWLIYSFYKIKTCFKENNALSAHYLTEDEYDENDTIYSENAQVGRGKTKQKLTFNFNRNLPLIFVVGLQGSGLGLMRKVLNEVPSMFISCFLILGKIIKQKAKLMLSYVNCVSNVKITYFGNFGLKF